MLSNTNRTEIKKGARKAVSDVSKLHAIIDESLIAHIAITNESGPVVIPMLAWRVDDYVYIHGANNSRLLRSLKQGVQTCLTFTLLDGWVLARSAFHHSAHYRSAVVFGQFEMVENNQEKDRLLNHFIEQIAPGRTKQVRLSNEKELKATIAAYPTHRGICENQQFWRQRRCGRHGYSCLGRCPTLPNRRRSAASL